jgi:hypothetical protein
VNDRIIEDPRATGAARVTKAQLEARECPFGAVAVPNLDRNGRPDQRVPVALARPACDAKCALYDEEADRPGCVPNAPRRLAPVTRRDLPPVKGD